MKKYYFVLTVATLVFAACAQWALQAKNKSAQVDAD